MITIYGNKIYHILSIIHQRFLFFSTALQEWQVVSILQCQTVPMTSHTIALYINIIIALNYTISELSICSSGSVTGFVYKGMHTFMYMKFNITAFYHLFLITCTEFISTVVFKEILIFRVQEMKMISEYAFAYPFS